MFENWQASIPSVSKVTALVLLILNIIFPSIGTFLMACLGSKFEINQIIVAVLQLITVFIIVGWIWSIWWGAICYKKSS